MNKQTILKILTVAGYSVNILLALFLIISAYGGAVDPERSTIPAILAMTFPLWLGLSVLTMVIDLFLNRWLALVQAVAIVCCLGPLLNFCPLNIVSRQLTPEEQQRSFTFMSYNVYGLNDYRQPYAPKDSTRLREEVRKGISNPTLSHILKQDIDILCLQEFNFNINPKSTIISKPLFDSICARYPYRITRDGNAILSKFPIYNVYMRQPESPTAFYHGAVANIQGHRTLIISAHLQSIGLDAADKELFRELTEGEGGRKAIAGAKRQLLGKLSVAFRNRANQARLLRQQIDSLGIENVIIAGDFNDIPNCFAIRQLAKDDFKSAFAMAGHGPIITYHANRFYFHIDHILFRGPLEAIEFHRDSYDRSDHNPITTRFLWTENAKKYSTDHKGIKLINP